MNAKTALLCIIVLLFSFVQNACGTQISIEPTTTVTYTESPEQVNTSTPTPTPTLSASITMSPTVDATQQTWRATAVAIQTAVRAASIQSWDAKETQVADFSIDCDHVNFYSSNISPNGKWFAASCDDKANSTLLVQNKEGIKWVLEFSNFVSKESPEGISGSIEPKFWSTDGNYLYFTIGLGYSGGGNYCFPHPEDVGDYGLFRLNLKTGSWVAIVPATDSFPGYEIEFSPTGRRYAITINGVTVTDLQTGKTINIETNQAIERLGWSPDGKYLAYSVASCDEQSVLSSSLSVWDALANQTQTILNTDGTILRPEFWLDNSTLRITEEKISDSVTFYTIFEYNILQGNMVFTGTATPYP